MCRGSTGRSTVGRAESALSFASGQLRLVRITRRAGSTAPRSRGAAALRARRARSNTAQRRSSRARPRCAHRRSAAEDPRVGDGLAVSVVSLDATDTTQPNLRHRSRKPSPRSIHRGVGTSRSTTRSAAAGCAARPALVGRATSVDRAELRGARRGTGRSVSVDRSSEACAARGSSAGSAGPREEEGRPPRRGAGLRHERRSKCALSGSGSPLRRARRRPSRLARRPASRGPSARPRRSRAPAPGSSRSAT